MSTSQEQIACSPLPVMPDCFNAEADLLYGCTTEHIRLAMNDFAQFLGFVNQQLQTRQMPRLESILMPANFSSMVGEFMVRGIAEHCPGLVKNQYHNGYPDLIPSGHFPTDSVQHGDQGIEVKASRYNKGWQGHNPEDTWLMVFVFDSNRPVDPMKGIPPKPFGFVIVVGARLTQDDWRFSGRSGTSRRTITAGVTDSGYQKMIANWIYKAPGL